MTLSSSLRLKQVIGQQILPKYLGPWFDQYICYEKQPEFLTILEQSTSNLTYKSSVLKKFITLVESTSSELHEDVFEAYASYLLLTTTTKAEETENIVNYTISNSIKLQIYETPTVISKRGSTGYRTWEAGLALADFLLDIDYQQNDNTIYLELGSGTGLVGLVTSQLPHTQRVILTDGDPIVIDRLRDNILLNQSSIKAPITIQPLWWGRDPPVSTDSTTTIIASDVTYDSDLFPQLVMCIKQHLLLPSITKALVSATIRSKATFRLFEDECHRNQLTIQTCKTYTSPFPSDHFFISPESADIVILTISRVTNKQPV